MKIFFDGGCRPNPGRMEIAVVVAGRSWLFEDVGEGTSEEAEWLALIQALRIAQELVSSNADISRFVLVGDAAGVVRQANGVARARGVAARHLETFRALAGAAGAPRVRHVGRSQNLAGILLARRHPR